MEKKEKQMRKYDIHLLVEYDDRKDCPFKITTDIKKERLKDIVEETIMAYATPKSHFSGISNEEDEKIEVFKIGIKIDLSDDTFYLSTNGSELITLGILVYLLRDLGINRVEIN